MAPDLNQEKNITTAIRKRNVTGFDDFLSHGPLEDHQKPKDHNNTEQLTVEMNLLTSLKCCR